MRRFYLLNDDDSIAAEGILFTSGLVAVSFLGEFATVTTARSIADAIGVHVGLGHRRIGWYDWGDPENRIEELLLDDGSGQPDFDKPVVVCLEVF